MRIDDIISGLLSRGCSLRPPARETDIALLVKRLKGRVSPDLLELYRRFDGLCGHDKYSLISLWPISEIEEFEPEYNLEDGYFAFSDAVFNAQVFTCSSENTSLPVIQLASVDIIAPSLPEFFSTMIKGGFDMR